MLKFFEIATEKQLLPVVPVFNYTNSPLVPWKDESNQFNTLEELKEQANKNTYSYINGNNETKIVNVKNITGLVILTGKKSGIMVIDLDRNHGKDKIDGVQNYKNLVDSLNLSDEDKDKALNTFTVKTPNGGLHLYFKYNEKLKNRNVLKNSNNESLAIDIKNDGGLIMLPGSIREIVVNDDEKIYKTYEIFKDVDIKEMPTVLLEELNKKHTTKQKKESNKKSKDKEKISGSTVKNTLETISEGGRNDTLFKFLCGSLFKAPNNEKDLTLLANLFNKACCNPPLEESELETIINQALKYVKRPYCDNKGNIIIGELGEHILQNNVCYVKGNMFYMYNAEEGYYISKDTNDLLKMYYDYCIIAEDKKPRKAREFVDLITTLADRFIDNFEHENRYIICKNGVLDSKENKLLEYSSQYKLDAKFNASYIADRNEYKKMFNESEFKKFLEKTLDKDTIKTVQQAWGTILCPNSNKVQQCFIYIGSGSNGKSSLFDIQEALFTNKKTICGISLTAFGDEFALSMCEGKRMNVVRDDTAEYKISGLFKSCVCGEEVTVNKKHKDLQRLKFNISWFFGLNAMPVTNDKTFGFYRRPILIPFNVRFGSFDDIEKGRADRIAVPGIVKDIIENEMDIVFNWAYEGLQILIKNGWKIEQSSAALEKMEEYKEESNSAYSYYKHKIQKVKGSRIKANELYLSYEAYCVREGLTAMNGTQFGRQMTELGHKSQRKNDGRYYFDIAFK